MPDGLKRQVFQTLGVVLLVVLCLIFAYREWSSFRTAWLLVLATLMLLFIALGVWLTKDPLGILVNERNLMSLSRLQIVCWTLIIFSTYIVMLMQRLSHGVPNALGVAVDNNLWAILGISTASFVGAPIVLNTKTDKTASSNALRAAGSALQESPVEIQQNAQGALYSNTQASDARFSDMFQGDEVGNTAYVDVSKVQMFLITVLLIGVYCSDVWGVLASNSASNLTQLPPLNEAMLKLFALSHAGYLTFKAVGHTNTTGPSS